MISDCLLPVITPIGAATILTSNGMEVLCDNLKFHKITCHMDRAGKEEKQYGLQVNRRVRLYLGPEARVMTQNGWRSIEQVESTLKSFNKDEWGTTSIRYLQKKCLICGRYYFSYRPVYSTCNKKCYYLAVERNILAYQLLTAKNVNLVLKEDWYSIPFVVTTRLPPGLEVLRIDSLSGATGVYINSFLISSESILEQAGYNSSGDKFNG